MPTVSVSSYSLREQLEPVEYSFTTPDGQDVNLSFPGSRELDITEFPARVKETLGTTAVETVASQFSGGVQDPRFDTFAANLAAAGVELLNAAVDDGDLLEADPEKRAADVDGLKRWIDRFAAMGSRFVRVNPGSPMSPHHGDVPPAHLVEALQELGRYANSKGVRLLVENHGGPSSDPAWMLSLLDDVGQENCGLLLDLGNFDALLAPFMTAFLSGGQVSYEDVLPGVDLTELYADIEALAPRAELVHVKTHYVDDDGVVGAVDLPRAIGILRRHGYDGPLTVEYEGNGGDPWAKVRRVLDVVNETVEGKN